MRTPWRMLADLVSGKSSNDETGTELQTGRDEEKPAGAETAKTAAREEAVPAQIHEAAVPTPEPENAPEPEPIEDRVMADDAATVETGPADAPAAMEEVAVVVASTVPSEKPEKVPARRRIVKAPAPVKSERAVTKRHREGTPLVAAEPPQETITAPKSALDEMVDLDREIEDLRKRLAEKLKRQNMQLRKLLDRYESR